MAQSDTVITFNLQGGWTSQPSVTIPADYTGRLDMVQVPHRDWYKFDGYFTDPTQGNEWWFNEAGRSRIDNWPYQSWQGGNVTLYARWTDVTPSGVTKRTATLNKDGGTGGTEGPLDAYYGYTLPWVRIPTKQFAGTSYNYRFLGYFRRISSTNYVKLIDGFGGPVANYPVNSNLTLYARWDLPNDTFTITFDTNGGFTLAPEERTRTYSVCRTYESQGRLSPTKTRTSGGGGSVAGPSCSRWGGLRGMSWGSFAGDNYGVATSGSTRVPLSQASPWYTLGDMCFEGWYTAPVGGTLVKDSDLCLLTEDITLYAHWNFATLTLSFDAQGGSFADSSATKTESYFLAYSYPFGAFPIPTRQGYKFEGWFTLPKGMTIYDYAASQGAVIPGPDYYTPPDIPRGGLQLFDSDKYNLVNLGATDVVGATQRGGMVRSTKNSAKFDLCIASLGMIIWSYAHTDAALVGQYSAPLFAHWTNGRSVTFDKCGGTGGTDDVTANASLVLPSITPPTLQYKTFAGYFDKPSGGTKYYNANGTAARSWDKGEDGILYAQWQSISVRVTIMFGAISTGFTTRTVGEPYGALFGIPSAYRPYYELAFYSLSDESESEQYRIDGDTIVTTATNHNVYIWFYGHTYNIHYQTFGFGLPPSTEYEYYCDYIDETYVYFPTVSQMNSDDYKVLGKVFEGWYLTPDFSGSPVTRIRTNRIGDVTVYAKIVGRPVTVTLNANGGAVSPSSVTVTNGNAYGDLPEPVRSGYQFDGWFTASTGGTLVTGYDVVDNTSGSIILFAHWTQRTVRTADWWEVSFE